SSNARELLAAIEQRLDQQLACRAIGGNHRQRRAVLCRGIAPLSLPRVRANQRAMPQRNLLPRQVPPPANARLPNGLRIVSEVEVRDPEVVSRARIEGCGDP